MKLRISTLATLLLVACDRTAPADDADNQQVNSGVTNTPAAPAPLPPQAQPSAENQPRESLPEPKGPIDPKSAEAAGQVVQSYGALIEEKSFGAAEKLWGDSAQARAASSELRAYKEAHLEIGKPGDMEGAAGSIYITMPVVLYGKKPDGSDFRKPGEIALRRVNDVPGSTEAQRRWHIASWSFKTG